MERLIVLSTKGKQFVITKPRWFVILDSDIEPYKYGFKGYMVFTTERWEYPIRIYSVHLQNSETLKQLGIRFSNQELVMI